MLVNYTVSKLDFYSASTSTQTDGAKFQCTCNVHVNNAMNSVGLHSKTASSSCQDWVSITLVSIADTDKYDYRCAKQTRYTTLAAKNNTRFQLTLNDDGSSLRGLQQASILPMKITICTYITQYYTVLVLCKLKK